MTDHQRPVLAPGMKAQLDAQSYMGVPTFGQRPHLTEPEQLDERRPDRWYTVRDVAPGLTLITEPHVHPMLSANIWWLRGGHRDVVIDAGLGLVPLRDEIPALFDRNPLLIVTHAHLDHMGGAFEFDDVAIHGHEADALRNPAPASLDTETLYGSLGLDVPEGEETSMLRRLPYPDYRTESFAVRPAQPTQLLSHGELLDVGTWQLQVIAAPGHTHGSICLQDLSRAALFTGDVVYEGWILDNINGADRRKYRQTMIMLQSLNVGTVYPGHGESFGTGRLQQITESYLADFA